MAYLVLARKYRPASFAEVVGQDHITRTLRNAIGSGRLGHAFLFSGLRGVGKTSVARILAKTINCMDDQFVDEPCGKCSSCVEIDESKSFDVVEMDAASHTGVDDIRELREAVMYAPGEDRYKVYIIDEVHMLSRNAFNALLKTLEEPPPRVIFVLATTEPHRVPVTIHSRCQNYDFRRIPSVTISGHLRSICETEGIEISDDSLRQIAIAAEGSLRDSQSLLDQVISFAGSNVSDEDVNLVLGTLDRDMLLSIIEACVESNSGQALKLLGEMIDDGADPVRIALDTLELIRALLIVTEVGGSSGILDMPEGEIARLEDLAGKVIPAHVRMQFAMLSRGEERMRRSPQPRFHLELALVHMARVDEIAPSGQQATLSPASGSKAGPDAGGLKHSAGSTDEEEPVPPRQTSAPAFASIETPAETWEKLVSFIVGKAPGIGSMLEQLVCTKLAGDELIIGGKKGELYLDVLEEREKKGELEILVKEFFKRKVAVRLVSLDQEERQRNNNIIENKQKKETDFARKIKKETEAHQAIAGALEIFDGKLVDVKVLGSASMETTDVQDKEEEL